MAKNEGKWYNANPRVSHPWPLIDSIISTNDRLPCSAFAGGRLIELHMYKTELNESIIVRQSIFGALSSSSSKGLCPAASG